MFLFFTASYTSLDPGSFKVTTTVTVTLEEPIVVGLLESGVTTTKPALVASPPIFLVPSTTETVKVSAEAGFLLPNSTSYVNVTLVTSFVPKTAPAGTNVFPVPPFNVIV